MKGPSIAVMLGHEPEHDEAEGEPEGPELKAEAEKAAGVFASTLKTGDGAKILRAYKAMKDLCHELDERGEDDGEEEKEPESEKEHEDETGDKDEAY